MPDTYDQGLECARRIAYLVSIGIHPQVINAAIDRSADVWSLGAHLGFIEDILSLGCVISDPEE